MVFKVGDKPWNKGKVNIYTDETIKKMKDMKLGKKHTKEHIKKQHKSMLGKNIGENNGMWKGDKVGKLTPLHNWIRRHKLKQQFCEKCKINKSYDLANISGLYKRDINDFEWLCRKCHMVKDNRINNLKQYKVIENSSDM